MLYPIINIDPTVGNGIFNIPSGSLAIVPVTVVASASISISMAQLSFTQDFSMRYWVSIYPNGIPVSSQYPSVWPLLHLGETFILYDITGSLELPSDTRSIGVVPGNYLINVLNLINRENSFSFSSFVLPSAPSPT